MKGIYKFEKDFLAGGQIRVHRKNGDTSFFLHRHDYYELLLYRNCGGSCELNGEKYEISDNCLFLLTPNDFHRIDAQNSDKSESIVVSFSESIADKELISMLAFSPRVWYAPTKLCAELLENLHDCYKCNDAQREFKMYHILNAILCEVLEKSQKAKAETNYISPTVARAMTMVLTDISDDITLTKTAAACGMTAAYFSDLFHKQVGKSFKQWLNSVRIEHAKRLLEKNNMPILEVCYECGYNTPSQFIKMFKRETGVTPTEYRKVRKP